MVQHDDDMTGRFDPPNPTASGAGLAARGIAKDYPTRTGPLVVLRDVSLTLEAGESAAIMGPSGSGKSTLLNILATLEPPGAGTLRIAGCDPLALSPAGLAAFRGRKVGLVFQEHHLLPQCTALENVLVPTLPYGHDGQAEARALELLDRVGLSARLEHLPSELSGGERQRVAIARALVNRPAVLLADEPTGNLDRRSAEWVASLLLDLHRGQGTVLVVVTHSLPLAERFGRRLELLDGTLVPLQAS
jgi:lipoprotein-releasing system ATP-binding protein